MVSPDIPDETKSPLFCPASFALFSVNSSQSGTTKLWWREKSLLSLPPRVYNRFSCETFQKANRRYKKLEDIICEGCFCTIGESEERFTLDGNAYCVDCYELETGVRQSKKKASDKPSMKPNTNWSSLAFWKRLSPVSKKCRDLGAKRKCAEAEIGHYGQKEVTAWICPKCGEHIEAQFNSCWNCGTGKSGTGKIGSPPIVPQEPEPLSIPTYLTGAIAALFFCWPIAILAIVNALDAKRKLEAGNYAAAREASAKAKTWCWISLLVGLIVIVLYVAGAVMS